MGVKLATFFLGLSLVFTITCHAVKNSGEDLSAVERIEEDGWGLPSEEGGLLKDRMVREADKGRREKSSKKILNKGTKLRQKDRKEAKKGKIGGFSERKTVKSKRKLKTTKNKNGKGVKKNKK